MFRDLLEQDESVSRERVVGLMQQDGRYLAVILDLCSRFIGGWVAASLDSDHCSTYAAESAKRVLDARS